MRLEKTILWVAYKMTIREKQGRLAARHAICEQHEWDAMEAAHPGFHTLIRAGIATEADAERLARETPGCTPAGPVRLKAR